MLVFFLLPKQLVLFRELDVQSVLSVNISCRRHHEQRYIFYLFILCALREVIVREMKNCLKCHVWGCPLDHLKGVCPGPSACSRGYRLWFRRSCCTIVNIQRISSTCLLVLFSIKVGLILSQRATENKTEEISLCICLSLPRTIHVSESYLVLP